VWILDVPRKVATRLTFEAGEDIPASWFPSGDRIVYTRHAEEVEGTQVAQMAADGSGRPQDLIKGGSGIISPDGKHLVYVLDDRGFLRLRYAERRGDGTLGPSQRLVRSDPEPSQIFEISLSPDGRLLAYEERGPAGEGGVFLTRFPTGEGRWQIAGAAIPTSGDLQIAWSRASNELFVLGPGKDQGTFQLMSVPITLDSTVTLGPAVPLFTIDAASAAAGLDVAPDGKSFVIGRDVSASSGDPALRTKFTLVENWFSEFARSAR
jgi:WD40 repeat protein